MLHPPVVHFAVVLPIISLVIGLAYLYKPSELMSKISTRFMVFATIFLIVAFYTGKSDASEAYILLSSEGQALLKEHKTFGLYLSIAMGIVALVKLVGCYKRLFKVELIAILLVALVSVGVMYQGKEGGELTYIYGASVQDHSDGMDCLAEYDEDDEDDE